MAPGGLDAGLAGGVAGACWERLGSGDGLSRPGEARTSETWGLWEASEPEGIEGVGSGDRGQPTGWTLALSRV